VPDPVGSAWRDERATRIAERPRLLLLGHLKGVVTIDGLRVVARELLPRLERALGPNGFELRIGGGYEPPAELRAALARPSVTFLGHLDDLGEEFQSAHVVLVPNTIPLGMRVRILTGFSYGACVVSHTANVAGIPELVHEENALLGASPDELVECILRTVREPQLREAVESGGRATYERWFAPGPAVGEIERLLEQIAASPVAG
jgi:glycosyltransferase involved in cell wall biosynthesis